MRKLIRKLLGISEELPVITEITRLNLQPGELLVVKLPEETPRSAAQAYLKAFSTFKNFKTLVVVGDVQFESVAPSEEEQPRPAPSFCEGCDCGKAEGCR